VFRFHVADKMTTAIQIQNISKLYHIGASQSGRYRTLRDGIAELAILPWRRLRGMASKGRSVRPAEKGSEFWALKDVSFDVAKGEIVGIIGRNGAGKSTLLKILSRITEPTTGTATLEGRVGSLLEVGTGFHMELTGRENIYLNGAILGMSRREITREFDEIVAFAEVEQFLDTPVKRYSSGMFVRLAFAVAAHLQPEILIVDEVLSVGDVEFQKKCLGRVGALARSGRTVLFVSHNLATVQNLCQKVVLLSRGRVECFGSCGDVVGRYLQSESTAGGASTSLLEFRTAGSIPVIQRISLRNAEGVVTGQFLTGEPMTLEIEYDSPVPLSNPLFGITFESMSGEKLFNLQSLSQYGPIASLPRCGKVVCQVPRLPLLPGDYALTFRCLDRHAPGSLDSLERAMSVHVEAADFFGTGILPHWSNGRVLVDAGWSFSNEPEINPGVGCAPDDSADRAELLAEIGGKAV
jgi:homopolymeric O-antigen transport system ATP-binding protein